MVGFPGHPMIADSEYHGDLNRIVGVFWQCAIHLGWGLHACRMALVSCEFKRVLGKVEFYVVISNPWYSQHQVVVPQGCNETWQSFFGVSEHDEDLHYMDDVARTYGSPIDHIEGCWGSEFLFWQVVLGCKILI